MTELPFIDEHAIRVAAPPDVVWDAIGRMIKSQPRLLGPVAAAVLGTDPRAAQGNPLTKGATMPGFLVNEAEPAERLTLTGRHRFAVYELIFALSPDADGTRLRALSYSRFPGPHGRAYRAMVVGSGGHRIAVRRMIKTIARMAESSVG